MSNNLKNIYLFFIFDLKTTGFLFFLPLIMWIMSIFQLLIQSSQMESDVFNSIILFQGTYIPLAGWGIMYRLKEVYEEGASETLIPYYSSNLIFDISRYLLLHLFGTAVWCSIFVIKFDINSIWPFIIIHFFLISLLFMFLGTTLIIVIKNIEISLTILIIYLVIEIATLGEYMPWPHVFLFQNVVWDIQFKIKLIYIVIYIIILCSLTFVSIKKNQSRFNG